MANSASNGADDPSRAAGRRSLRRFGRPALAAGLAALAYVVFRTFAGNTEPGSVLDYLSIGLGRGAIYAFIALGYTMVYGVIRLINFAHGEFVMVGAFAGFFVLRDAGIERWALPAPWPVVLAHLVALLAAALASGLLALAAEALCYRPIRKVGRIAALLTAVGLSLFLQNIAQRIDFIGPNKQPWPAPRTWAEVKDVPSPADANYYELRTFPDPKGGGTVQKEKLVVAKGGAIRPLDADRLAKAGARPVFRRMDIDARLVDRVVLVMLAIAGFVLWFLVQRTRTGRAMRAVSEDMPAARLMGVNVNRVVAATFFLGAFLAGLGGVALCSHDGIVEPLTGFMPGLKAFIAAVLGGIGSIPGAIIGGLFLGVMENLFGAFVSTQWKDGLAFVVLVGVLLVRPTGLLGKVRREKI
jgi:branched-chain amino acid transport system permease protein